MYVLACRNIVYISIVLIQLLLVHLTAFNIPASLTQYVISPMMAKTPTYGVCCPQESTLLDLVKIPCLLQGKSKIMKFAAIVISSAIHYQFCQQQWLPVVHLSECILHAVIKQ